MAGTQANGTKPSQAQAPSLRKSTSSSTKQTSIAGFFQRKTNASSPKEPTLPVRTSPRKRSRHAVIGSDQSLTPAPSSDAASPVADDGPRLQEVSSKLGARGLPSPITPADSVAKLEDAQSSSGFNSPSRKVRCQPRTLTVLLLTPFRQNG